MIVCSSLAIIALPASHANAQDATPPATGESGDGKAGEADPGDLDCFEQLVNGDGERITCSFPVVMSPGERKQVSELTRGFFKDAQCMMRIDIARKLVDDAQSEPDHIFISPPQPVNCEIETSKSKFPVTFSFAPRAVFKQGKAVEASPGMGNVKGVGRILSWPVEKWVNASDQIEEAMVRIINAFFARFGRKRPDGADTPETGVTTPIRLQ